MTDTEIGRILKEKSVTIFGAGGLGSNVAIALSRMGVGTLYIVDYDKVEKSNLNRQYYFLKHIGMKKVEALRQVILDIDPDIMVNSYDTRITEENVLALSEGSDIIVEALDEAEIKAMVINMLLVNRPSKIVISGSGMAGYGNSNSITTRMIQPNYYTIGDGISGGDTDIGMMAARVGIAANHQANLVVSLMLQ